jgi:hypothetical protein
MEQHFKILIIWFLYLRAFLKENCLITFYKDKIKRKEKGKVGKGKMGRVLRSIPKGAYTIRI